jgi:hypothetical protein
MRLKIAVSLLIVLSFFLLRPVDATQPLFSNNLFSATPRSISISFNTPFSINVTNLQNNTLWIFCLAQENISRVDAPSFYTMMPNETYIYQFISPNMTAVNASVTTGYGNTTVYEIYFGAVNAEATSFQTTIINLQMTTVESLNVLIQQLLYQNGQLQAQVTMLLEKAGNNNILIIGMVIPWILFPSVILYMRLSGRKKSEVKMTTESGPTA